MQIERAGLRPGALVDGEREPAFSGTCERAPPFAVAAVEYQHAIARFQPQHAAEIIGLRGIERDACALRERRVDVKAGGADIAAGHGARGCGSPIIGGCGSGLETSESERPVKDGGLPGPATSDDRGLTSRVPVLPCYRRIQKAVNISAAGSAGSNRAAGGTPS